MMGLGDLMEVLNGALAECPHLPNRVPTAHTMLLRYEADASETKLLGP